MTPQELKTSVLWSAIQGKISKQEESESAQDILSGLSLSAISEDECYFDIPSNWKWCKIKDIFTLVNGKAFKPTDWGQTGLPIVRIQNLNDSNAPFNYFSGDIEEKYILHGGELLFSWSGTPGTSFGSFIWNGGKAVLNQHIFIVYPRLQLDTKYAMFALNGELKIFIEKAHGGAGLKHITKKEFENCVLPIPPLAEQKRIVAKLEEILPLIDRYEVAWNKLEEFNKRFPVDMQKSILQIAMQGKLVPQNEEEIPQRELFTQVQHEYKRSKPLPKIADEEIPHDIPDSWFWVRLGDALIIERGGSPRPIKEYITNDPNGINWIKIGDTEKGGKYINGTHEKIIPEGMKKSRYVQKGDFLLSNSMSFGRPYILNINGCIHDGWLVLRPVLELFDKDYLYYLLSSPMVFAQFCSRVAGAVVNNLNSDKVAMTVVPVPPLAEQKRIVAKLEEILPLCDRLK